LTEPSNTLAKLENTEKNVQDKTKVSADNKVLEKAEAVEKPSMRSESTVTFTENFSQELPIEASIAEDLKSESDMMTGAAAPVVAVESVSVAFNHPDGIFEGANADVSRSVKQQPKILDLLTAAF
jgi:hypothetical protein